MLNKKIIISCIFLFQIFILSTSTVEASGIVPCGHTLSPVPPPIGMPNYYERCTVCDMFVLTNNIIAQLRKWVFITAVFMIAIAGVMYIVSTGNESMTSMAKTAIKAALIGSTIVFVAWLAISTLLLSMAVKDSAVSDSGVGLILNRGRGNIITGWKFVCQ